MKFTIKRLMNSAIAVVSVSLVATSLIVSVPARANVDEPFDAAGTYKAKCVACHSPAAAKHFDKAKGDAQLVDAVVNGKQAEKPPNMPAYGAKGVTAEQAKALVDYMKQL